MPKYATAVADISFDTEVYDGFWDQDGDYTPDPKGSDLRQYRLNLAFGKRLSERWQLSIAVPYVWNVNKYSGISSSSRSLGDTTLSLWYEALEDKSAWKVRSFSDMAPAVTIGASLLIPTGISPYDDVDSSFDVTGRGFYRVDANVLIDKTVQPWNASLALSYGKYIPRPVNQEYGKSVEPYTKTLGDRFSAALSAGRNFYIGTGGDTLNLSVSTAYVHEGDAEIDGAADSTSSFHKQTVGAALAYSSTDHDWGLRTSWVHGPRIDGWGENFPVTDVYSVGVRYVIR